MTSIRHNPVDSAGAAHDPDDGYLDAARDAILAVGWSRTTLTDIARRAGVSRMTLYRRWPDMETMLADLMTREWTRAVRSAVNGSPADDPLVQITEGVVATVQALRTDALLSRIIELDPELLLPYLLHRRGRSQDLVAEMLADLIGQGQRQGAVREGDPVLLARSVLLASHGFALSAQTMADRKHGSLQQLDRELARFVTGYLRP